MAARLIMDRTPDTRPPIPDREDDLESFWHVLLWIALKYCDHQLNPTAVVDLLGSLFDHQYIGQDGQVQGGQFKFTFLMASPSSITAMKLGSQVLDMILVDTAEVLAIRYPSRKAQDQIPRIQEIWQQLELENSTLDKELLLFQRIHQDSPSLMDSYILWKKWRIMQDDAEWMETIFGNALQDPSADWNTGSANIQRILPRPSAPKRKSESDIDERKPKKVSNLESLPE